MEGRITAVIACESDRKPARVILRLPHPTGQHAVRVTGGAYDPATETVTIDGFTGRGEVTAEYCGNSRTTTRSVTLTKT